VCPEGPAAPVLRDRERERAELGAARHHQCFNLLLLLLMLFCANNDSTTDRSSDNGRETRGQQQVWSTNARREPTPGQGETVTRALRATTKQREFPSKYTVHAGNSSGVQSSEFIRAKQQQATARERWWYGGLAGDGITPDCATPDWHRTGSVLRDRLDSRRRSRPAGNCLAV